MQVESDPKKVIDVIIIKVCHEIYHQTYSNKNINESESYSSVTSSPLQAKQILCLRDMSNKRSSELMQNCVYKISLHCSSEW